MPEAIDTVARADATKAHQRLDELTRDVGRVATAAAVAAAEIAGHTKECAEHRAEEVRQREEANRSIKGVSKQLWGLIITIVVALLTVAVDLVVNVNVVHH